MLFATNTSVVENSSALPDGGYVSVAPIEPQFYALLLDKLGMSDVDPKEQDDHSKWPALKARFSACFRSKTRREWCELLEGTDVCFAPVLSIAEALVHPHNVERGIFSTRPSGSLFPKVAPRFKDAAINMARSHSPSKDPR